MQQARRVLSFKMGSWRQRITSILVVSLIFHTSDGLPLTDQDAVTTLTWKNIQAAQSCQLDEFFSFHMKTCRKCGVHCKENTTTAEKTCTRQCAAYFLQIKYDEKEAQTDHRISNLQQEITEVKSAHALSDSESKMLFGIGMAIIAIVAVFSIVVQIIQCRARLPHWHGVPRQDPENTEYEVMKAGNVPPAIDEQAQRLDW